MKIKKNNSLLEQTPNSEAAEFDFFFINEQKTIYRLLSESLAHGGDWRHWNYGRDSGSKKSFEIFKNVFPVLSATESCQWFQLQANTQFEQEGSSCSI